MGTILDRYGIKEVADVTFYELDSNGKACAPVLFLDTLKVSTIEQTAEQAEARGGKGNPPLIIWDYGKEINVTLEDALFSAKSMAIMFGDGKVTTPTNTKIVKTVAVSSIETEGSTNYVMVGGKKITITESTASWFAADGTPTTGKTGASFATFEITASDLGEIVISANSFPGTYYVTGDTYARSEASGKDEFFQFIIPKAKVQSENTITLEAEGDPSVFNMSLRVLRPSNGEMMKLVKYQVNDGNSSVVADTDFALKTTTNTTNAEG